MSFEGGGVPHTKVWLRVWGPPGTGKTWTLIQTAANLLNGGHRVLALTYTTSAAREMRQRVLTTVPGNHDSLRYWGTIHSLAVRSLPEGLMHQVVQSPAHTFIEFAREFGLEYERDDKFALKYGNLVENVYTYAVNRYYPIYRDAVRAIDAARADAAVADPSLILWARKYEEWKREKREEGTPAYDFTDMLILAYEYGEPPETFDYVLIDEAQDLSPLQLLVLRKLYPPESVSWGVFGDPLQNIYETLQGAPPDLFLSFRPEESRLLTTSYRLRRNVWLYALRYAQSAGIFEEELLSVKTREGGRVIMHHIDLKLVRELVHNGYTVAILRRTNRGVKRTERRLIARGIVPRAWKESARHARAEAFFALLEWVVSGRPADRNVRKFLSVLLERDQEIITSPLYDKEYKIRYLRTVVAQRLFGVKLPENAVEFHARVYLDTIHAAKGREADYVFIDTRDYRPKVYDVVYESRVLYVGITRAREGVIMC